MPKVIDQNKVALEQQIYFEFRRRQFEALKKTRYGLLHVTDMNKACVRNTYYSKMASHNITHNYDVTSLSHFFGGEAVHQLLDSTTSLDKGEYMLWYNFVDDKPVTLFKPETYELTDEVRHWDVKDWLKVLVGERDAIYPVKVDGVEHEVLVDYKTMQSKGFKKMSASPEHIEQLNIYRYLTRKMLSTDVEYGAVIYLDFDDKLSKPKVFVNKLASVEDTQAMLLTKYAELIHTYETGILPERVKTWLCDFCPYASRCIDEDAISPEENKLKVIT